MTMKMDKPIVNAAFRAMGSIETEKVQLKRITLYGGEPFLTSNREVITHILMKGKAKGYRFAFVTNGVELDDYLPIFDDERIDSVQITLDGPPEVHDRRRVLANGKGTFEKIAANIDRLLNRRIRVNVRVNLDKDNIEHVARLTLLFAQRGWSGHRHFFSYLSPTHSLPGKKKGTEVSLKDLKLLSAGNGAPIKLPLPVNDYGITNRFVETLQGKGLFPFKPVFCGSNTSMYVFDPHGDIFTCWDPVGIPEEKVGRFLPELSLYREKLLRWQGRLVSRVSGCRTCKYAFFCGGGCSYLSFLGQAGHYSPFCQEFPEIFKRDLLEAFFKSGFHSEFLESTSDQFIH